MKNTVLRLFLVVALSWFHSACLEKASSKIDNSEQGGVLETHGEPLVEDGPLEIGDQTGTETNDPQIIGTDPENTDDPSEEPSNTTEESSQVQISTVPIPLIDLTTGNYMGFSGGLYPDASNTMPQAHYNEGVLRASEIQPLDFYGNPDSNGYYVFLSMGMSNASREFCSGSGVSLPCNDWSFSGQAAADLSVNDSHLLIVNAAKGGEPLSSWNDPNDPIYDEIRDKTLNSKNISHAGIALSEAQVQVIWLKNVNSVPSISLPDPNADAYNMEIRMGDHLRALKIRYPNLKQVFISSRIYAGYATTGLNPEPYAYESGFAVKWLIEAQINQMNQGGNEIDPLAGDLNYDSSAPWITWGPYLWADGTTPRSDGLVWNPYDFDSDGTHPSPGVGGGEEKVGTRLLDFFKSSPHTQCWFLKNGTCS